MSRRHLPVVALVVLVMASSASAQPSRVVEDVLLDMLVWGAHMGPLRVEAFADPLKAELVTYLRRIATYRSARPAPPRRDRLGTMVYSANVSYERRLAATASGPEVARLAAAYVTDLRPCYEWEGFNDCPEREALFADRYQAAHPRGPFNSYLPLLAAHRWLCAAEAFEREGRLSDRVRALQLYGERLATALASSSSLVRAAAVRLSTRATCYAPSGPARLDRSSRWPADPGGTSRPKRIVSDVGVERADPVAEPNELATPQP